MPRESTRRQESNTGKMVLIYGVLFCVGLGGAVVASILMKKPDGGTRQDRPRRTSQNDRETATTASSDPVPSTDASASAAKPPLKEDTGDGEPAKMLAFAKRYAAGDVQPGMTGDMSVRTVDWLSDCHIHHLTSFSEIKI